MLNLPIKQFFIITWGIIGILLLAIFWTAHEHENNMQEYSLMQQDHNEMVQHGELLRTSSDNLTKYARLYAITNNTEYRDNYFTILDIRNGLTKRPQNYHYIYWDLLEPLRSETHPLEHKKSLTQIFAELPYDKEERSLLALSESNSNKLARIEIEAFNALNGLFKDEQGQYSVYKKPQQDLAIAMLHSPEYLKAKEGIMLPLDQFFTHLEKRFALSDKQALTKNIRYEKQLNVLFSALFIVFIGSFLLMKKKIIAPISNITQVINDFKVDTNTATEMGKLNKDEIGFLGKSVELMQNDISQQISVLNKQKQTLVNYIQLIDNNIMTFSFGLDGTIQNASDALSKTSGYAQDELIGMNVATLQAQNTQDPSQCPFWENLNEGMTWQGDCLNQTKSGSEYWIHTTMHPVFNEAFVKTGYTAIAQDISDTKKVSILLAAAQKAHKEIQHYVELVNKNIITSTTDLSGKITFASEAFCNISGYTNDELVGQSHRIVRHPDMPASLYEDLWETISQNKTWHGEIKNLAKNGTYYWVDATIYPIFDDQFNKIGYTAIRIDISDKKKVEKLLILDALTHVYNRRYFNETMPIAVNLAKRTHGNLSLIILDIDHFKQYNDTFGHHAGDDALKQVASCIKETLKPYTDHVFRLGGEEFGAIIPELSAEEAMHLSELLRNNVISLNIPTKPQGSGESSLTISIGLVSHKIVPGITDESLYKEADKLLYQAKDAGRNMVMANIG